MARDLPQVGRPGSSRKYAADGIALEIEGLSVRLGDNLVLSDVSLTLARGALLAVIGPNGAGKTVLFRALIGAVPHQGSIRWAPDTKFGYVPQKLDIERDLPITGHDLMRAKLTISHSPREELARALARVELHEDILGRPIGHMSGGQFQRLLVAFALVGRPNVLLLDEPAAGIDAPGQHTLNTVIQSLREEEGVTTLLISHDLSVVYRYATSVLCMARERTVVGAPQSLLTPERLAEIYGMPVAFHIHDDHGR